MGSFMYLVSKLSLLNDKELLFCSIGATGQKTFGMSSVLKVSQAQLKAVLDEL